MGHDAVEALPARENLARRLKIGLGDKTASMQDLRSTVRRGLDLLGKSHFLLAGEERCFPHVLEIHAQGIIQAAVLLAADFDFGIARFGLGVLFHALTNADRAGFMHEIRAT